MKKIFKNLISFFVIITLCFSYLFQNEIVSYANDSNQYIVLIQQKDGSWKEYNNMIEKSRNGNLMMKAKILSKALGFSYKYNKNGTFIIKKSSKKYNTYNINSMKFTYTNGTTSETNVASNIAYTSKISNYNLCHVNTLSTLVNYKYFSTTESYNYKNYSGVICFSKYKVIPVTVPKSKSKPKSTKKPTPTPQPAITSVNIEGVHFPVRKNFLTVEEALSDWGGYITTWYLLEKAMDGKLAITTDLIVGSNTIEFTHLATGFNGILLTKTKSNYKIEISVKLDGSTLSEQNATVLNAMIVTISSEPTIVYKTIFESFTSDKTHGINEKTYVKIGDSKVKIKLSKGKVTYYIKKA